ncbi:hypothetical protein Pcinc_038828 [Petrolisthes cinctipes]|uniref:Uncharacterized protein n=1 Tax=Petrolisthes cinctipes TaxID=88211 RepID=A0AAE1EMM3_PETCI|nr:hypothetical protein Pcinc_038828 [Petrolisthes cinctipes]
MEGMTSLIQYLQERDEQRRIEDERRRAEEVETKKQEMAAFMVALTNQSPLSSSPDSKLQQHQPTQHKKPVIKTPSPLQADASFQQFRDWKRRWQDYSVMTDLSTIPLAQQHIQHMFKPGDTAHSTVSSSATPGRQYAHLSGA